MPVRALPPVHDMIEPQLRGTRCVWCSEPFGVGLGADLGEQRVVPPTGAAYSWFPRECVNADACAERAAR